MMRRLLATAALLALASCGQPATDSTPPAASTPAVEAPATTEAADDHQAEIAALPAPYNAADYAAGQRVFAQCRACHTIEEGGPNRVGPNLHAVFGREIGSVSGFTYSQAVQDANFTWDASHLDQWLQNPQTFLPGNRMAFAGVRTETQRRDVIAYLMIETN
jgi:cytochrome c